MERDLGMLEQYFAVRTSLDMHGVVVMWIEYDTPIDHREIISNAVESTIFDHAILRAKIKAHPSISDRPQVRFLDPKEISVEDLIAYHTADTMDMTSILREMHCTKIDILDILWRIVVYNQKLIIIVFDHTFMDGNSGAIALKCIDKYINKHTMKSNSKPDMTIAPLDQLIQIHGPSMFVLKEILNNLTAENKKTPLFGNFETIDDNDMRWHITHIDKEKTTVLIEKCRDHGATLTTLFHTIMIISLSLTYTSDLEYVLESAIPIDLRRKLEPAYSEVMGVFVSSYKAKTTVAKTFDWDMCKDLHQQLTKAAATDDIAHKIGLLKLVRHRLKSWTTGKIGKPRSPDAEITNVGAKQFHIGGTYTVIDSGFSAAKSTLSPGIVLSCIGVAGGSVNITFSYASSILQGDEKAQMFLNKFNQILAGIM
ncbi:alcohol acetyltransferase [Dipodascopsis uninucleata]